MFKILDEVCTPQRATKYSAYVDLFSREDVVIGAGETKVIKLGVKLDLEALYNNCINVEFLWVEDMEDIMVQEYWENFLESHYLEVALRSSLGVKGLIISNGIGIIDLDYPDEIGLIVHNPIVDIDKQIQFDKDDDYIEINFWGVPDKKGYTGSEKYKINKGDKVAQCTIKEHKGYLMGYESDITRNGGFGSTGE